MSNQRFDFVLFHRVTPEEIYNAEKNGRDLVWPGTEVDEPEEEAEIDDISDLNDDGQYIPPSGVAAPYGHHMARHDSRQSVTSAGGASSYAQESTGYHIGNDMETVGSSSSSSSHHASNNNLNQALHTNHGQPSVARFSNGPDSNHLGSRNNVNLPQYSRDVQRNDNGYQANKNGSAEKMVKTTTNMAKSNSLSDYNIYSNGNLVDCSFRFYLIVPLHCRQLSQRIATTFLCGQLRWWSLQSV